MPAGPPPTYRLPSRRWGNIWPVGPAGRHGYAVSETSRDGDRWRIRVAGRSPRAALFDIDPGAPHRTGTDDVTGSGAELGRGVQEVASISAG
ncbi:hypothetical protein [Streptomyces coelicoflavus]